MFLEGYYYEGIIFLKIHFSLPPGTSVVCEEKYPPMISRPGYSYQAENNSVLSGEYLDQNLIRKTE